MMALGWARRRLATGRARTRRPSTRPFGRGDGSKANRYGYPYGITVNSLGQRFFDEGEARHSYTYMKTGWAVLSQQELWRIRSMIRRRFRCSVPGMSFPRADRSQHDR